MLAATALAGERTLAVDLLALRFGATVVRGQHCEHVALRSAEGVLRLDVAGQSVVQGPVALTLHLDAGPALAAQLATLHALLRHIGRPHPLARRPRPDAGLARLVEVLRVADALAAGIGRRAIADTLLGSARVACGWDSGDDVKSLIKRRIGAARRLIEGGPFAVLRDGPR